MMVNLREQFNLEGRVAVITGAANILGPEFAAALAEFGAQLVLVDINGDRCSSLVERIRKTHTGY